MSLRARVPDATYGSCIVDNSILYASVQYGGVYDAWMSEMQRT